MSVEVITTDCIEKLLSAMTKTIGQDGLRSSFMFGRKGAPLGDRRMGTELFYHPRELTLAALYLRQNGPSYLRYLPISDLWRLLQDFVIENYWLLANETFLSHFEGTYARVVSNATKLQLANELAQSSIFDPENILTTYPLFAVRVTGEFDSSAFFFSDTSGLLTRLPTGVPESAVDVGCFPPLRDHGGRKEAVSSWLGIRSPSLHSSEKMKSAVLGAMALTILRRYRHSFSGRHVFGGRCTFNGTLTTSFGPPHTPPIMNDVIITKDDEVWLAILARKLLSQNSDEQRHIKALEYFYRAWDQTPPERFPIMCMALDAVFGDANSATQSVIEGVRANLGEEIPEVRLKLLMKLRASVIHGGAPEVYDSSKYGEYYSKYSVDPIEDLELVVSACLRKVIFGSEMKIHADPHAETIRRGQESGRLPAVFGVGHILSEID